MAHNTLYPAHVEIEYTTAYAPHTQTIPSVPVFQNVGSGTWQFDLRGAAVAVDWDDAVMDYAVIMQGFYPATTQLQVATLFQWDEPDGIKTPVATMEINLPGTSSIPSGSEAKATQATFTWRTDEFGIFKIVYLDPVVTSYEKIINPAAGYVADLHDYVTADVTWMAGRDGGRPLSFLQASFTMNKRLRRSYRMN